MFDKSVGRMAFSVLHKALDLVYPRFCSVCNSRVGNESRYICWDCMAGMDLVKSPFCSVCGDPVDGIIDHDYICSWCVGDEPYFDMARSAACYKGSIRTAVHAFKYRGAGYLSGDLVVLLEGCIRAHYDHNRFDAITCVPLHVSKQRKRTYNQAALLAKGVASKMELPLVAGCLERGWDAGTQTGLTAKQRIKNVRGVFQAKMKDWIEGRSLLIIDDVMTTGATANECARVLKEAGAAFIGVATLARG